MLMMLMKFSFVPQHFFRFFFKIRIRISISKSFKKVMLCVLKIPIKFGVVSQSLCQNQNPGRDQDQDQDHDFIFDFSTRPTFYTLKASTKFYFDSLTPPKVIVSTSKVYVRTYRRADRHTYRQTDIFLACFVF